MAETNGTVVNGGTIPISELLGAIEHEEKTTLHTRYDESKEARRALKIRNDGVEQFYDLRTQWSWVLTLCIAGMIGFQMLITVLIGAEILTFTSYKEFLYVIIGENFLHIIGMGLIIVKFLYSKNID